MQAILMMMSPSGEGANPMNTVVMFVLLIGVFYFFMIRPQLKKQKEQKAFRESLKTGSSVVTMGGIHGKISAIQDTTVHLKTEDGSMLKVERSAIVADFNAHQQGGRR